MESVWSSQRIGNTDTSRWQSRELDSSSEERDLSDTRDMDYQDSLDASPDEKEELPNAMEFVSVECDMFLEPDCALETNEPVDKLKETGSKSNRKNRKSRKKAMMPYIFQTTLITDLFRYRGVDVYRRTRKNEPFVKIFNPSEGLLSFKNEEPPPKGTSRENEGKSVYECTICGKQFTSKSSWDTHMTIHFDGEFYHCEVCQKKFADKKALITHRILHMNAVGNPYPCTACGTRFTNRAALKSHMQNQQCVKHIQCELCEKNFENETQYAVHKQIHMGEKPFQCAYCEKSFTYKFQASNHEKLHTGEGLLKCDECDATFTQKQTLIVHKRKHSGERPFKCDKCSAAFRARSYLWAHKKSHVGKKPRECPDCGSMFWKSSSLKKHRKAEHD